MSETDSLTPSSSASSSRSASPPPSNEPIDPFVAWVVLKEREKEIQKHEELKATEAKQSKAAGESAKRAERCARSKSEYAMWIRAKDAERARAREEQRQELSNLAAAESARKSEKLQRAQESYAQWQERLAEAERVHLKAETDRQEREKKEAAKRKRAARKKFRDWVRAVDHRAEPKAYFNTKPWVGPLDE